MNDSAWEKDNISTRDGHDDAVKYYKKDFWSEENLKFTRPHFRLQRSALDNKQAGARERVRSARRGLRAGHPDEAARQ